jgi:two-component sensor histidine kinase
MVNQFRFHRPGGPLAGTEPPVRSEGKDGGSKGLLVRSRSVALVVIIWTGVGVMQAIPDVFRSSFYWSSFVAKLIEAWTWALLTPAVLLIDRKLTVADRTPIGLIAYHLALSLPLSLIHTGLSSLFEYPIEDIAWNPLRRPQNTRYYYLGSWMMYCAFVGTIQALKFYDRSVSSQFIAERAEKKLIESEKKLAESRLNALRLQLEPHFLFNTLNAISSKVVRSPEIAREMIEDLGALLRRSIDYHDSIEITLSEELALLDHYLAIQKLRFGKRIAIRIDVEPEMRSVMVPSMLLQPLIENSIQHGFKGRRSGGKVVVTARRIDDHLEVKVVDDGVGLPACWRMEACTGLGLSVTRERLKMLYSGTTEHSFTVAPAESEGTAVTIRIPLHGFGDERDGAAD